MTHKTTFIDDESFIADVQFVHQDVKRIRNSSTLYENDGVTLNTSRAMTALNRLGYESHVKLLIIGLIRDTCARVDLRCGNHADMTLAFLLDLSEHVMRMRASGIEPTHIFSDISTNARSMSGLIEGCVEQCDIQTAEKALRTKIRERKIASLVLEAIRLAGMTGKISVKKTPDASRTCIELISGHAFELEPAITLSSVQPWRRSNVKCVVIDGIVESVSEFDRVFRYCNENKESLLVFARGYGQEVTSTIATNRLRKTLDVHPMIVSFDARKANVLNDLAVIIGCDVVSALKGELIETIDPTALKRVRSACVTGSHVLLEHDRNTERMAHHIQELERSRDALKDGDLRREIYDERIRSLLGLHVHVSIGGSPRESQATAESVDAGLRYMRALLGKGVLRRDELLSQLEDRDDIMSRVMINMINEESMHDVISSDLILSIMRFCNSYVNNVFGSAGSVVTDQSRF